MKIDDNIVNYEISKHLPKSTQNEMEKIGEKQLSDEQKVEEKDRSGQDTIVNLSQALKETQIINEIIASEPDVREDKISELKERIESGKYQVDNDTVANKLVNAFIDEIS
ncbi:MAG: flagellar biosynthesis anti-sigma factor FlgM [Deltaproteobacteria bacterium]|nr:flagellar biosynthesis anti-sigma factor FlgM [Deltaproteobacteria bacterium]